MHITEGGSINEDATVGENHRSTSAHTMARRQTDGRTDGRTTLSLHVRIVRPSITG